MFYPLSRESYFDDFRFNNQTCNPMMHRALNQNQCFRSSSINYPNSNLQYIETYDLDFLYPKVYKLIYPVIKKVVYNSNLSSINEPSINNIVEEVFKIVEGDIITKDDLNSKDDKQGQNSNCPNQKYDTKCKDELYELNKENLKDLIKILVIRLLKEELTSDFCPYQNMYRN